MKELKITATTEQEFREQAYEIAKSVNTTDELAEFVKFISNVPLDYGTAVYAQCAAMLAAQHVINESEQGGITGFQAGFIGCEMVKKFMSVGDLKSCKRKQRKDLKKKGLKAIQCTPVYVNTWSPSLTELYRLDM